MGSGETPVRIALVALGELSTASEAEEMSQNDFIGQPIVRVQICICFSDFGL